eukprot:9135-Heterococcus_DN1.PRE.6
MPSSDQLGVITFDHSRAASVKYQDRKGVTFCIYALIRSLHNPVMRSNDATRVISSSPAAASAIDRS